MIFIYFIIKNGYLDDELGSIFRTFGTFNVNKIFFMSMFGSIPPTKLTELH